MGERSVFATQAHVFQIDPQTKKKWLPSSTQAVRVSYYYDPNRKTYRIITMENKEVLINSTITANMTFTKTSPKFGQWSDHRANTVFGLGFSSEKDLNEFQEKFMEAKKSAKELLEHRRQQKKEAGVVMSSPATNVDVSSSGSHTDSILSPASTSHMNNGSSSSDVEQETNAARTSTDTTPLRPKDEPRKAVSSFHQQSSSHSASPKKSLADASPQVVASKSKEKSTEELNATTNGSITLESQMESLKFENSKLKVALASSAQNVKKWEIEMQTLRNNNTMLTTALEESTQHVAEWKKQLQKYKEECDSLKKKVAELEAEKVQSITKEMVATIEAENEELKDVLTSVQVDLEQTTKDLEVKTGELRDAQKTIKTLGEEKRLCESRIKAIEDQSQRAAAASKEKLASAQQTVQQLNHSLESIMHTCQTLSSQLHD